MILRAGALGLMALWPVPARAQEKVDLGAIHRIKREAFQGSKVMDHLFYLTDRNGPRLTGSPGFTAAAEWSLRSLKSWGIASARAEPRDRKSTRLNSSHLVRSYAVFCLKKKKFQKVGSDNQVIWVAVSVLGGRNSRHRLCAFFLNDAASPEIYTLSLHVALPI